MNLYSLLKERDAEDNPVRVALIGAGKFSTMFLAQARQMPGIHVLGIADIDIDRARHACLNTDWRSEKIDAPSLEQAYNDRHTFITDDAEALIEDENVDVVIEATGDPAMGINHCLAAIDNQHHIIMVNVEADVVAGPLLAKKAQDAGLVYSLAWGDQPAIICEHVDWARACGFDVVCAGKGTRYHPDFHNSTPDSVWENYGWTQEVAERSGANPKMFNSFIDGTKSAIEMTAVCNATGLTPQPEGLNFPPASATDLAEICKPLSAGGKISHAGTTEVVSSLFRDMSPVPNHIQMGTYVVIEADNDYVRHCFEEYWMLPDRSHNYAAMFRPTHLIGLELGVSIASIAVRDEPTGYPKYFNSDVIATAKKELKAGEILDGEGGFTVWGKQLPAETSLEIGGLPLGLANDVRLKNDIRTNKPITWSDVELDESLQAHEIRKEMEKEFAKKDD